MRHLAHVATGTKGAAGAGEHHRTHLGIARELANQMGELALHGAAEGIDAENGRHLIVADGAKDTADAVLALTVKTGRRVVPAMHSCQYDVLVAVLEGAQTPRDIRLAIPTWSADRVKQACTHLVESGWLRRTGATSNIRYHLCSASDAATRTA